MLYFGGPQVSAPCVHRLKTLRELQSQSVAGLDGGEAGNAGGEGKGEDRVDQTVTSSSNGNSFAVSGTATTSASVWLSSER